MVDDKNTSNTPPQNAVNKIENENALSGQNPLHKGFNKVITPEDIENEQLFKEAQTERD
jgi:hypothetical protein